MFGTHSGLLTIKRRETNTKEKIVWSRNFQTNYPNWRRTIVEFDPGLFQISLEGVIADGPLGDIAIDDISIGKCKSISNFFLTLYMT